MFLVVDIHHKLCLIKKNGLQTNKQKKTNERVNEQEREKEM